MRLGRSSLEYFAAVNDDDIVRIDLNKGIDKYHHWCIGRIIERVGEMDRKEWLKY